MTQLDDYSRRTATVAVVGVIAAAYKLCGRTAEAARLAILDYMTLNAQNTLLTVGDLFELTSW